jgi:hypothetical protein
MHIHRERERESWDTTIPTHIHTYTHTHLCKCSRLHSRGSLVHLLTANLACLRNGRRTWHRPSRNVHVFDYVYILADVHILQCWRSRVEVNLRNGVFLHIELLLLSARLTSWIYVRRHVYVCKCQCTCCTCMYACVQCACMSVNVYVSVHGM